jgi:hypothetical protein
MQQILFYAGLTQLLLPACFAFAQKPNTPVYPPNAATLAAIHQKIVNSGHTFHEADFQGTNALLYPRLGDFAILKPTPTAKDPAAAEVMRAGLFDDDWKVRLER